MRTENARKGKRIRIVEVGLPIVTIAAILSLQCFVTAISPPSTVDESPPTARVALPLRHCGTFAVFLNFKSEIKRYMAKNRSYRSYRFGAGEGRGRLLQSDHPPFRFRLACNAMNELLLSFPLTSSL